MGWTFVLAFYFFLLTFWCLLSFNIFHTFNIFCSFFSFLFLSFFFRFFPTFVSLFFTTLIMWSPSFFPWPIPPSINRTCCMWLSKLHSLSSDFLLCFCHQGKSFKDIVIPSIALRSKLKQLRVIGRLVGAAICQDMLLNLNLAKHFVKQVCYICALWVVHVLAQVRLGKGCMYQGTVDGSVYSTDT